MINIKKSGKIKFIIFILLLSISLLFLFENWHYIKNINMEQVYRFIEEQGFFSYILYLAFFIIKPFFIIIPTNIIAILGGVLFGPIKGFLLTMTGFFMSGGVAFYISRYLGRDFVEGIVGNRFIKLDNNMENNGFKILFLLRLPPILPYDPLSYACGLTKINFKDFILASLLGVVPETLCYSVLGKSFKNPLSIEFLLPMGVLLLGVLLSKKLISGKAKENA